MGNNELQGSNHGAARRNTIFNQIKRISAKSYKSKIRKYPPS